MNFESEKGSVKVILIVVIALIIIVGIAVLLFRGSKKENNITKEEIPLNYFVLTSDEDDFVGVVDREGNEIIPKEYTNIYIPNQSKDVFICYKEDEYSVLNKNGKDVFVEYENVSPIFISNITLDAETEVLSFEKDGKYGLVDFTGRKIVDANYDEIVSLPNKPGYLLVKKDNSYGVLDSTGKTIIEVKYNSIKGDGYSSEQSEYEKAGYVISEKTNSGIIYGYINYEGKMLVEPKYESISRVVDDEENEDVYLIFMENGKKGVIKNKKVLIKPKYQSINFYSVPDIFVVKRKEKVGFYNISGNEILPIDYDSYSIAGNYISVTKDDSMFLYDEHGNLINTNKYKSVRSTGNPNFFIAVDENGFYSIIGKDFEINNNYMNIEYAFDNFFVVTNTEGKTGVLDLYTGIEVEPEYDYIIVLEGAKALEARLGNIVDIYSNIIEKTLTMQDAVVVSNKNNYFSIYNTEDLQYIDSNGKVVKNTEVYPDAKLYTYKSDEGKWGYVDKNGTEKVSCKYDLATELNEYGFAGVLSNGKWGVVNAKGEVVVEPTYDLETYYFPKFIGKYLLEEYEITSLKEID